MPKLLHVREQPGVPLRGQVPRLRKAVRDQLGEGQGRDDDEQGPHDRQAASRRGPGLQVQPLLRHGDGLLRWLRPVRQELLRVGHAFGHDLRLLADPRLDSVRSPGVRERQGDPDVPVLRVHLPRELLHPDHHQDPLHFLVLLQDLPRLEVQVPGGHGGPLVPQEARRVHAGKEGRGGGLQQLPAEPDSQREGEVRVPCCKAQGPEIAPPPAGGRPARTGKKIIVCVIDERVTYVPYFIRLPLKSCVRTLCTVFTITGTNTLTKTCVNTLEIILTRGDGFLLAGPPWPPPVLPPLGTWVSSTVRDITLPLLSLVVVVTLSIVMPLLETKVSRFLSV
mmetsp:Transcript_4959/g.14842  ORF Transcript_4959/g.14842 Transcript_4959/m.14842 type:complete len:336 (-) Transcript_4959:724-1731(-)